MRLGLLWLGSEALWGSILFFILLVGIRWGERQQAARIPDNI